MESFFLAETVKYLYLLFDTDNFLHELPSNEPENIDMTMNHCELSGGGYIFNTEAHPLDAGLIHCCSLQRVRELEETTDVLVPLPHNSGLHSDLASLLMPLDDSNVSNTPTSSASLGGQLMEKIDASLQVVLESDAAPGDNASIIGSEAWVLALWQDMTKIVLLPPKDGYPLNYSPPLMRGSPPLLSCPVIRFNTYLKSFQDMDFVELL